MRRIRFPRTNPSPASARPSRVSVPGSGANCGVADPDWEPVIGPLAVIRLSVPESIMKMGKAIDRSHDGGVVPPDMPTPRKRKVGYALLAAVPAAVVLGAVLTGRKRGSTPEGGKDDPAAKGESDKGKG